jgi:serine O-acetyltransferase
VCNRGKSAQFQERKAEQMQRLTELIDTILQKDPAARSRWEVVLCYPGFHAVVLHDLAHHLWLSQHHLLARCLSHFSRFVTGIEIHPGASLGRRLFIDHGMGVVIGETTVVGDDVVLYQAVTLGTGVQGRMGVEKRGVKRHPTLGNGVVVGSGAEVQGDILVGDNSRIASGSIVLADVPPNCVVVGVPGRIVYKDGVKVQAEATINTDINDSKTVLAKTPSDKIHLS